VLVISVLIFLALLARFCVLARPPGPAAEASSEPAWRLGVTFDDFNFFDLVGAPEASGIVIFPRVWSLGGEGALLRWRLEVSVIDRPTAIGIVAPLSPEHTIRGDHLHPGANMLILMNGRAVPLAPLTGWLSWRLNVPFAELGDPATRLRLVVTDTYGRETATERRLGEFPMHDANLPR
jgi:hypothetical protein